MWRDTEIALGRAIAARPVPYLVEHAPVEPSQKSLVQDIALSLECPRICFGNILLLKLIQLAAQRDMGRNEAFTLDGRQRGCGAFGIGWLRHPSSQRRAGR